MTLRLGRIGVADGYYIFGLSLPWYGGLLLGAVGDLNDDGFDDVIVTDTNLSRSNVLFGSTDRPEASIDVGDLDGSNGFTISGSEGNIRIPSADGAGDVNGDGVADLIVGTYAAGGPGTAYVLFGSGEAFAPGIVFEDLGATDGFAIRSAAGDDLVTSVAGAGDVNGDGFGDLILGAPAHGMFSGVPGDAYVVFGRAAGSGEGLDIAELNGSNGFRIAGAHGDYSTGSSVSGAGDLNGDGFDDVIVAASGTSFFPNSPGVAYVVFGSANGFDARIELASLDATDGFRIITDDAYDVSVSVAGAGDLNGDGIADLAIGIGGYSFSNRAAVVFGSSTSFGDEVDLSALDGTNGFRLVGGGGSASVAGPGDVNGDGFADLIVSFGSPYSYSYVLFGSGAGFDPVIDLDVLDGSDGFRIDSGREPVTAAGDVNGDGLADLIIGGKGSGSTDWGAVVVYGSRQLGGENDAPEAADDVLSVGTGGLVDLAADNGAGPDRDGDFDDLTITSLAGVAVASGDTVTLDSGLRVTLVGATEVWFEAPDLAVGAALSEQFVYQIADGRGGVGGATVTVDYVQDGLPLSTIDGTNGFVLKGERIDTVDGAGDINGDGIDDLIVRADGSSGYYGGKASYVIFGTSEPRGEVDLLTLDGTDGFRFGYPADSGDHVGAIAGAGDVNGDGLDDIVFAGTFWNYGYVLFGSTAEFPAQIDGDELDGENGFQFVTPYSPNPYSIAISTAAAGDVNGDGFDDLIVGQPTDTGENNYNSGYDTGGCFVLFGSGSGFDQDVSLTGLDGTNGFRLQGIDQYDFTGLFVAGAGDINGDGIDDLIIGARNYVVGSDPSVAFVVFGTRAGFAANLELDHLDGANGFKISAESYFDRGNSLAGAGDVNGDGIDDLVLGSSMVSPAGKDNAGSTFVVFGRDGCFDRNLDLATLDGSNGFRVDGAAAGNGSGGSVDGAGDFNGDGIGDLIIGAAGTGATGASYLIFGSADGFAPVIDLGALDPGAGFRIVGVVAGEGSGASVSAAGDVNADGFDDLVIGSVGGACYVVYGFGSGGSESVSVAVAAGADDAEQCAGGGHVQIGSRDLDLGVKEVGLRFTGIEVPEGAVITGAHVEFEAAAAGSGEAVLSVALEATVEAAAFGCGAGIVGREFLGADTEWRPGDWVAGGVYATPDLAPELAALVGTDGIAADEALVFRFSGTGSRSAAAFESDGAAARLVVDFEEGTDAASLDLAEPISGSAVISANWDQGDPWA